ncbi:MAG TPA: hypothetical protein VNB29_04070, partial [Chthoniobacterales bacterium]|nr:hypothetical protein [Chthoniobacterales bacterium]
MAAALREPGDPACSSGACATRKDHPALQFQPRPKTSSRTRALFFLILVGASSLGHGAVKYTVIDLGVPAEGSTSSATAINNSGEIAGTYLDTFFVSHACFWTDRTAAPETLSPPAGP